MIDGMIRSRIGVAYTRVSSGSQLDGGGLNSQLTSCERHCPTVGGRLIESFEDGGVSGGDLERPGIKKMFDFIDIYNKNNAEKITFIIADNADRIARDVNVHWALKLEMHKRGLELITVNQKFEDTPQGHFIETMMAANAQLFREENKHRVITRQEARLMDGYRPFNYPIGYKTTKAPAGGRLLIPDEPYASFIKEGLESYAYGILNSIEEVANFLQRKGLIFTRCQNKRKLHSITIVHVSTTARILKNILYAGYIEYQKTTRYRKGPKKGLIKKSWDVPRRKGQHEGIISLEVYEKIQERLGKKKKNKTPLKKVNEDFPLRGFLICDCCNRPLSSGITKKHREGWKDIPYYSFNKKCTYKGKCVNAEKIHKQFDDSIKGLKMDDRTADFLKELLMEEYKIRQNDKILVARNIDKELFDIDDKIDNTLNAITSSSSEIVRRKLESKVEELESMKQTLKSQLSLNKKVNIEKVMNIAFDILKDPYYVWANGNVDEKRMFYQLVFRNNLQVNKKSESFGTLPISALFLLNSTISGTEVLVGGDDGNRTRV